MATSEIEKLERRYAENPHGLTFAPLAEVHRKNGDVARALELLTAGLELHPNYIPASIVLGRCHQDLGDLPSAEAAFAHVLRLDDENVIALKSLADINERQERFGEAETWLRRLVSIDRSNDEAREQLRRVEAARQGSKSGAAEVPAPAPALELIDLPPEPAVESTESAKRPTELLPVDLAAMQPSHSADQPPPDEIGVGVDEPGQSEPMTLAASSMAQDKDSAHPAEPEPESGADAVTAASVEEPVSVEAEEPVAQDESGDEEEAEVMPLPGLISAEFQPPLESTGGLGVETSEEVVLEASGNSEFRVPDASEDFKSLAARLSAPSPAPVSEPPQEAAPVEAPESDSPGELRFLANAPAESADEEPPPQRRSYAATDTKGQSVAAFFQALVAARPPAGPAVAGKQGGADDGASGDGVSGDSAAVSFDDFFESEAEGSKALRQQAAEPGKDDLDQFQSWLQNLKR
jgi:tetratricopeptide (TPR) repeat protein